MRATSKALLLAPALLPLAACAAPYGSYRFAPNPLETIVAPEGGRIGRVLVSVVGVREAEDGALEMHVLLRVENEIEQSIELVPEEVELIDAELRPFAPARIEPDDGLDLAVVGGESRRFLLRFPFPGNRAPSRTALSGLLLSFGIRHPLGMTVIDCTFDRVAGNVHYHWHDPYHRYDYWGPHVQVMVGHHLHN